jgi:hypothetical protein
MNSGFQSFKLFQSFQSLKPLRERQREEILIDGKRVLCYPMNS